MSKQLTLLIPFKRVLHFIGDGEPHHDSNYHLKVLFQYYHIGNIWILERADSNHSTSLDFFKKNHFLFKLNKPS